MPCLFCLSAGGLLVVAFFSEVQQVSFSCEVALALMLYN